MWVLAVVYGFPVLWFLLSSFKPGSELFTYPLSLLPQGMDRSRASPTPGSGSTSRSTS